MRRGLHEPRERWRHSAFALFLAGSQLRPSSPRGKEPGHGPHCTVELDEPHRACRSFGPVPSRASLCLRGRDHFGSAAESGRQIGAEQVAERTEHNVAGLSAHWTPHLRHRLLSVARARVAVAPRLADELADRGDRAKITDLNQQREVHLVSRRRGPRRPEGKPAMN